MYRFVIVLIFFISTISLFSEEIILSKIKVILNDDLYIWSGDDAPEEIKYILSFFKYKPGDIIELKKLEKEVSDSTLRIIDSNLFYAHTVSIIPPRKYPDKRTIVINIKDGFRYRFGGGYAYGFFGNLNVKGSGDTFLVAAGLNKLLFDYKKFRGANKFYIGNKFFLNPVDLKGYNSIYTGYKINPDLDLSFYIKINYIKNIYPSIGNRITYTRRFTRDNLYLKTFSENLFQIDMLSIKPTFKDCFKLSFLSLYSNKINLKNSLYIGNYLHDEVTFRNGFEESLEAKLFLLSRNELYYNIKPFIFPPIINLQLSPYIFGDLAKTSTSQDFGGGVGLKIYFDSPVFTEFRISYSWSSRRFYV